MDSEILNDRLNEYHIETLEQEENAIKEILQEIALYALSTTDFFRKGSFQGGTALRIAYSLPRFSEDLDFILDEPDKNFNWKPYIQQIEHVFSTFSISPEVVDRSKTNNAVQKLFLKDNSIGKLLELQFKHHAHKKILIKFEIDTNPPAKSEHEIHELTFPLSHTIKTQDLPSNFAGKCHALLCRNYVKGRDWYDLVWYIRKKISINYNFISNAMDQNGPWEKKNISITKEWIIRELENKISTINWHEASIEVLKFAPKNEFDIIKKWDKNYFLSHINLLKKYL